MHLQRAGSRESGEAPRKPCRSLKWEGSVFITFLIQKKRERARKSKAAWPGAKRRWLCGYPEGFFLLLEKSECRFRETGWCAQEDQWIWEGHWWHMLGFRGKWQLWRQWQEEGRKQLVVSGMSWGLPCQTESPPQGEEEAPWPWSSKVEWDCSHRCQGVKFQEQASAREALLELKMCCWWEMVRKGLSSACKTQTNNSPNQTLSVSHGVRGFSSVNVYLHGSFIKTSCKPLSWTVWRCSPVLCSPFVSPGLQPPQHTHPAHGQPAKALGPAFQHKNPPSVTHW